MERNPVEGDRRKIALSCTEKAKPIVEAGIEMQKQFFEMITNGISEEKWKVYNEIHETIEANAEFIARDRNRGNEKQC